MWVFAFALLVIAAFGWHVSTREERVRIAGPVLALVRRAAPVAVAVRSSLAPFREALRARTPHAVAVPLIAGVGIVVFVRMATGDASLSDPNTLVAWGASVGPKTTDGGWWRLAAMLVVHGGLLHLLVNTAALVQAGMVLERLVGSLAVAVVYLAAGLASGLVQIAATPVAVSTGSAGAIAGLYGLLLASWAWTTWQRSAITIPWRALALMAPAALLFTLYNLNAGWMDARSQFVGFGAGVACGLAFGHSLSARKPTVRTCAAALAVACVAFTAFAFPLRGIADPRVPLERLVAAEDRTAALYTAAVRKFTGGRVKASALVELIEGTVVPELEAAGEPVASLPRVPREYQPAVSAAEDYLRLRLDGWRRRAMALRGGSMGGLRAADQVERASLQALQPVRSVVFPQP